MRTRRRWFIGSLAVVVSAIIVIALLVATRGPPPLPNPPTATFTSVENGTDGVVDLALIISTPTNASLIRAHLGVDWTSLHAMGALSSSPVALVLEPGREFTLTYIDKDGDGMVESGDGIRMIGPFDGGEYTIGLIFEPAYMTICSVTTHVN